MSSLNLEALLAPLSADAPCGADLVYDPAFQALEDSARGKPEQQFGDTIIAAQAPDWRAVHAQALELAGRTRDLRIAVCLLRAACRQSGITSFAQGLSLVHGLLERHWEQVYPLLDAEDNNDPTMRLNALAPLVDLQGVLADLRATPIGTPRAGLTLRDLELALGKAQPRPGESVRTIDDIVKSLEDREAESPGALAAMRQANDTIAAIDALLAEKVPGTGPDLKPLQRLTQMLATAATRAAKEPANPAEETSMAAVSTLSSSSGSTNATSSGAISSRDDAIKSLERVCAWIERNEPSNPAPLLIRRAQRLMSKNFIDIIRDLVPDGIDQVQKIAGVTSE